MTHVLKNHQSWINHSEFIGLFSNVAAILQKPEEFFEEIRNGIGLSEKIQAGLVSSIVFLALYGAVLGSGHLFQAVSSAIKMPLVFLISLVACAPTLYIFDLLLGSKRSLSQTVAVLLTALTATSVLLFSFAPITVAFRLMVSDFQFFNLLNVGMLLVALVIGVFYLANGLAKSTGMTKHLLNDLFYAAWILLFLFMISQVAWSLRPFLYYPGTTFTLFAGGGNLLKGVGAAIGEFLGLWTVR